MARLNLIENKNDREKALENERSIEVLSKTKEILTLEKTGLMTVQMCADYFEVSYDTINSVIKNNRKELEENGLLSISGKEIREKLVKLSIYFTNFRGYFECFGQKFANRNNLLINKRVLLNIAMLLRDSLVAKEVRKRLLDIIQDSESESGVGDIKTVVNEIDEELKLSMDLGVAIAKGEMAKVIELSTKINQLKNKRIEELEISNEKLEEVLEDIVDTNTKYETLRRELVGNLKSISHVLYNNNFKKTYSEFYRFLLDNGYNLELRRTNRKRKIIDEIDDINIDRLALETKINGATDELKHYKRNTEDYIAIKNNRDKMNIELKDIKLKQRQLLKDFNKYDKGSKLEFIKDEEYEDIIVITRAWALKNGYDWREGLDSRDDTYLPF